MKILGTGSASLIGSAVIRHIIRRTQDEVVNLDKLTYEGDLERLSEVNDSSRYAFKRVDICERTAVEHVHSQHLPDAIMHIAAESHVDRSIDDPAAFITTNIFGTYTLLEAARQYWQNLDSDKCERTIHSTNKMIAFEWPIMSGVEPLVSQKNKGGVPSEIADTYED